MKVYDVFDWYWNVGDDGSRVYSSKLRDYVLSTDPTYADWIADGTAPTQIDTEHSLGGVAGRLECIATDPGRCARWVQGWDDGARCATA